MQRLARIVLVDKPAIVRLVGMHFLEIKGRKQNPRA